ncbi:MAG: hypothetical protein DRQ55_04745 [Planctomycetota bacterium]|nr:MAG: hypothetical protein DRQ55_04745 [Planctomycetota bacterium]
MSITLLSLPALLLGALCTAAAATPADQISGVVKDSVSQAGIGGALVSLQASAYRTTTAPDGSFVLDVPSGTGLVIVGASKGYFNSSEQLDSPASDVTLLLDAVPQDNNLNYQFLGPNGCSFCHYNTSIAWEDTPMANAGLNTWVHDIYNGDGTAGGLGGFVYTRDSTHAGSNPDSECAACHQPELWIENGFAGALDSNIAVPVPGVAHGISCEACHKIADIDESRVNFPGIHPDAVTFTLPEGNNPKQVQYGMLGDVNYVNQLAMRASYQPQLAAAVCAACHQDKNDPDGNGNFEEPNGVISEPTYLEWLNSPYADENSPSYASCVDCHMPPSGFDTVCNILFPQLVRDPDTIRSHDIRGTTPEFLDNAAELDMTVTQSGMTVQVDVDVINSLTGHHVPTGVTVRNMILLVEAWPVGGDPLDDALLFLGDETVHDLGGVGDPALGYYAGQPGRYFGKVNHDVNGEGPTFFTDATGITFDNRIPALATDSSSYTFLAPAVGQNVNVRARLIYRRAFRALVDAKQWTEDGHGNPLEDVAAPHYGHLMEQSLGAVSVTGNWSNLGLAKAGASGLPTLQGAGPLSPDSHNELTLRDARANAIVYLVVGLNALNMPFMGGTLVPAPDVVLGFTSDSRGSLSVPFPWRAGLPSGLDISYQMWIADDTASFDLASSNGLMSTSM